MTNIPAVTVIVPVYKVAPYIEKCARSLFEQTLESLEIIFISDCTPDNSIEIIKKTLEEYPERIPLTRIIELSNNIGLPGVRKRGIIESKGQYIIHCDGDDWVDATLYDTLYKLAINKNADIAVCDEALEYENRSAPAPTRILPKNGKELLRIWYRYPEAMFCHNKLAKRSLYLDNNVLPWVGLNMWEDNGLFTRLFYYAERVAQISGGPVYHYNRANVNAMTAGYGIKQVEQMIAIAQNLTEFFESKPDAQDFAKTVLAFQFYAKLNLITNSFKNYKRYKEIFPNSNSIIKHLDPHSFSKKGRIRFRMVQHGFAPLFILLFKIKVLFDSFLK